jgi:hypothetical protein
MIQLYIPWEGEEAMMKIWNPRKWVYHGKWVVYSYILFLFVSYKCGHRNVLSKRQVWMSIFHIINLKKKKNHTGKFQWLDNFILYTVNGLNITFSNIPVTCYLLSNVNLVVNSVYFLLNKIITIYMMTNISWVLNFEVW